MAMIAIQPGVSPEFSKLAREISDEIYRLVNNECDANCSAMSLPFLIVFNPILINPERIHISPEQRVSNNGIKHSRKWKELWTSVDMDYHQFAISKLPERGEAIFLSLIEGIRQIPNSKLRLEYKTKIINCINLALDKWFQDNPPTHANGTIH